MTSKKQAIVLTAFLALAVVFAGCTDKGQTSETLNDQVKDTSGVTVGESFWWESRMTEENQQNLAKAQPPLQLEQSLERQNLRERYKTLNQQNEEFYVYLISHGQILGHFVAQGKVSSVNSKLTQPEQLVECDRDSGAGSYEHCVVSSPQMDGSYGTNGDGVFFFTADGRYVEVNTKYIVSNEPINVRQPVQFTADVDDVTNEE